VIAARAPAAMSTGGEVRSHDMIAYLELAHAGADSDDVAYKFVSDNCAAFQPGRIAIYDVQVGSTDPCQSNPDKNVFGIEKSGRRYFAQCDRSWSIEDDRAHAGQPNSPIRAAMFRAASASAASSLSLSGSLTISFTPSRLSRTGKPIRVFTRPYAPAD
jgi:hypothetical protein